MALHLVPDILLIGPAAFTASPVFTILPGILGGEFVAILAMSFCAIACAVCRASQSKPRFINLLLWQKNFFNRPAKFNALVNGLRRDSKFSRPLPSGLPFTVKLKKAIHSPITHLARSCRPPAIRRLVVSVIVNSINGHAFIRMPHILKKIGQTIAPSIANSYASAAVVFIRGVAWVKASLLNAMPYGFNSGSAQAVSNVTRVNFRKMSQLFFSNHNNSPLGVCNIQREWSQS